MFSGCEYDNRMHPIGAPMHCIRRAFGLSALPIQPNRTNAPDVLALAPGFTVRKADSHGSPNMRLLLKHQQQQRPYGKTPHSSRFPLCLSLGRGCGGDPFFWHKRKGLPHDLKMQARRIADSRAAKPYCPDGAIGEKKGRTDAGQSLFSKKLVFQMPDISFEHRIFFRQAVFDFPDGIEDGRMVAIEDTLEIGE